MLARLFASSLIDLLWVIIFFKLHFKILFCNELDLKCCSLCLVNVCTYRMSSCCSSVQQYMYKKQVILRNIPETTSEGRSNYYHGETEKLCMKNKERTHNRQRGRGASGERHS